MKWIDNPKQKIRAYSFIALALIAGESAGWAAVYAAYGDRLPVGWAIAGTFVTAALGAIGAFIKQFEGAHDEQ